MSYDLGGLDDGVVDVPDAIPKDLLLHLLDLLPELAQVVDVFLIVIVE